ncbi:hypothetical protein AAEH84_16310 [Shewanella indica]|uniref:hypothetical protein n=1 Tax=Shewanella indica TaxID=768528 RepID=UPI00313BEEA3
MRKLTLASLACAGALQAGCSSTPQPIIAQEKTVEVKGQTLKLGGRYFSDKKKLELTVNGDPIMRGTFPPYTPTQNLGGRYQEMEIDGKCYFGSVLGSQGGAFGIIASAVQSSKSSNGDKCEILVDGKTVENLYF